MLEEKRFVYVLKNADPTSLRASPTTTPAGAPTPRVTALGNFTSPSSSPTSHAPLPSSDT